MRLRLLTCAFCLIGLIVLSAGCGSGSSTESSATTQPTGSTGGPETTKSPDTTPKKAGHSGFSATKLAEAGKEASQSELESASEVLSENLKAREAKNWAGQCASLSAQVVKRVENEGPALGAKPGCAARLGEQAPSAPAAVFKDTLPGQIDALRVKGNSGSAFFHGNDGKSYIMPMRIEGGEWKVDSLLLIVLSN